MALSREYPHSFADALKTAREILSRRGDLVCRGLVETEAEQIVEASWRLAGGKPLRRSELLLRAADRFPEAAGAKVLELAGARAEGKILQHLTGYQCFLDHEYRVGPEVLVPRPETELLVMAAIRELSASLPALGFEVGLGSGVISVELLAKFPGLRMVASELSSAAARIASRNATAILGTAAAGRLQILEPKGSDQVLEPFSGRADFIISNPPYLVGREEVDEEVFRHEPHVALFAPEGEPLHFYRRIALDSPAKLVPGGWAFVEVPHERAEQIAKLFEDSGWRGKMERDLNGRERVWIARHGC